MIKTVNPQKIFKQKEVRNMALNNVNQKSKQANLVAVSVGTIWLKSDPC